MPEPEPKYGVYGDDGAIGTDWPRLLLGEKRLPYVTLENWAAISGHPFHELPPCARPRG
jgi:hypothetical protein